MDSMDEKSFKIPDLEAKFAQQNARIEGIKARELEEMNREQARVNERLSKFAETTQIARQRIEEYKASRPENMQSAENAARSTISEMERAG